MPKTSPYHSTKFLSFLKLLSDPINFSLSTIYVGTSSTADASAASAATDASGTTDASGATSASDEDEDGIAFHRKIS